MLPVLTMEGDNGRSNHRRLLRKSVAHLNLWRVCVSMSNSSYGATPECGDPVGNGDPAGRDVGAAARGCAKRRHPRLQG